MEHLAEKTTDISHDVLGLKSNLSLGKLKSCLKEAKADVVFLSFPPNKKGLERISDYLSFLELIKPHLKKRSFVVLYGTNEDLALLNHGINVHELFQYQTWIAIRQEINKEAELPNEAKGAIVYSNQKDQKLEICKVRLPYTYCPACDKTTKDYGGKKHLYHEYGTLMRDVWKDFSVEKDEEMPNEVITRIKDMFSVEPHKKMLSISLWDYNWDNVNGKLSLSLPSIPKRNWESNKQITPENKLILGDVLEELSKIESNYADYIFVDPPYNLEKQYYGYHDALEIEEYFAWCNEWMIECYRVLKPGRFFSILNLPLWCSKLFALLIQKMDFSSWIVWDALSRPSGKIMPSHYSILTFKKSLGKKGASFSLNLDLGENLMPKADLYCRRKSCRKRRKPRFKQITDLWTDIPRVKHNSRRYDHPTQLPSTLMKRLISIYTDPGEIVLDCFNGIGTTTLSAQTLKRKYVGIELIEKYYNTAIARHKDAERGLDPFRKNNISAKKKVKNNEEKRRITPGANENFTKKDCQLEIKRLSKEIGKIPTMEEALKYLDIPRDFYETYFHNWSEVTAAARTTGMTENKRDVEDTQLRLFEQN